MPIVAARMRRYAPCTGKLPACTFSYFLFLLTSSFVVQSLRSHPRHHTQHKDSDNDTQCKDRDRDCVQGSVFVPPLTRAPGIMPPGNTIPPLSPLQCLCFSLLHN